MVEGGGTRMEVRKEGEGKGAVCLPRRCEWEVVDRRMMGVLLVAGPHIR